MNTKEAIKSLVDSLNVGPAPFEDAFELLGTQLAIDLDLDFTCKVGPNLALEFWLDSLIMTRPLATIQVVDQNHLTLSSCLTSPPCTIETNHEGLQDEILKLLSNPMSIMLLRVACRYG